MKYSNPEHTVIEDGNTSIPLDSDNRHYKAILVRVAAGEVIADYVAPVPTDEEIAAELKILAMVAISEANVDDPRYNTLPDVVAYRDHPGRP